MAISERELQPPAPPARSVRRAPMRGRLTCPYHQQVQAAGSAKLRAIAAELAPGFHANQSPPSEPASREPRSITPPTRQCQFRFAVVFMLTLVRVTKRRLHADVPRNAKSSRYLVLMLAAFFTSGVVAAVQRKRDGQLGFITARLLS